MLDKYKEQNIRSEQLENIIFMMKNVAGTIFNCEGSKKFKMSTHSSKTINNMKIL